MTPLGRLGTPDDVANAITFLASTDAGFIVGEVLVVDGLVSQIADRVIVMYAGRVIESGHLGVSRGYAYEQQSSSELAGSVTGLERACDSASPTSTSA